MKTLGATAVDVAVPELAKLVTAANLLTQELKVYLGDYLKSAGAYASSIDDLLEVRPALLVTAGHPRCGQCDAERLSLRRGLQGPARRTGDARQGDHRR